MRQLRPLAALFFLLPASAQGLDPESRVPQPPRLWAESRPNARYGDELQARIQSLTASQRETFFRRVREQQRQLRRQMDAAERDLRDAKALLRNLASERSPLQKETAALVDEQTRILDALRSLDRIIISLRKDHDTQRIDAEEMRVDLYGGFQFSSLFRNAEGASGGFFSKSKPFAALDIRQTYRRIGENRWVEAFGTLSFQSSTVERSEAATIITTTGHVRAEVGAWWMKALNDRVSYGIEGALGMVGYSEPVVGPDGSPQDKDSFRSRYRLGLTIRQEAGALKGSFAEVAHVRDPLFRAQERLFLRGRVVLTQFGSEAASGDFYTEGSVSKGRRGRDEATLLIGLRLSTVSFFRSLGAGRREE